MAHQQRKQAGLKDFILMEKIEEKAFLDNLKVRYDDDSIYSYIGDVVISINPYKTIPDLYSPATMEFYKGKFIFEPNLHPHVFALTDNAYRAMLLKSLNCVVIISGESGAGKTEASKRIMEYIAAVSGSGTKVDRVKEMLLGSNPVLEAFGNAKTNRNDNSSRFGKYMDIQFDYKGAPVGGNISNYLLEKSRVVHQLKGERNFHIFYELLTAGPVGELGLKSDPSLYHYLNQGESSKVKTLNDQKDFEDMKKGMTIIGFSSEDQSNIFKILAAVLHLGNFKFDSDGKEGAVVTSKPELDNMCKLISTSAEALQAALTHSTVIAGGNCISSPISPAKATHSRDALAKAMYDRLFTWIVQKINTNVASHQDDDPRAVIGVLDIYGFEIFEHNSFEQFCINFCNEKLQQLFIELTLKSEQEEYVAEGITWTPIDYFNNKVICDLVEEKHKGMISLLDEECLRPGDVTDAMWLEKLDQNIAKHAHYSSKKTDPKDKTIPFDAFRLKHYAGDVTYNIEGFIEKNIDTLFKDIAQGMFDCGHPILKSIFPEGDKSQWKGATKRPVTAGTSFKKSMNDLIDNLLTKTPSYIRCIKPNAQKASNKFDVELVRHQVRYLGLVENVRVRRAGFCFRQPFDKFLWRYKILSPKTWPQFRGAPKEGVQELLNHLNIDSKEYQLGKTKLFLKNPQSVFKFEEERELVLPKIVSKIQAAYRGYKVRDQLFSWARALQDLFKDVLSDPTYGKDARWPTPHKMLLRAEEYIKMIHANWRAMKIVQNIPENERNVVRKKCISYSFVGGGKKPWNFSRQWTGNYVSENPKWDGGRALMSVHGGKEVLFAHDVVKISRGGRADKRIIVVTDQTIFKCSPNMTVKPKNILPIGDIRDITVSGSRDTYIIIHSKTDGKDIVIDLGLGEWERATELLAELYLASNRSIEVKIQDTITYNNSTKPGKTSQLSFQSDTSPRKPGQSLSLFKKGGGGRHIIMFAPS